MGKVVCITSSKGGVGKTLFTISLAGILSNMHQKCVIVDFDLLGGGIALSLNTSVDKTIYDLYKDIKLNRTEIITKYVEKYDDYIDVLSCPKDPRETYLIEGLFVERTINFLKQLYDIVLIDTNCSLKRINDTIYENASEILHIVTNDPIDLKNTKNTLEIFNVNNINNYKIVYNGSRDTGKDYFSLFDIKNIIGSNLDYTIPNTFYIEDIDKYTIDGKIITQDQRLMKDHKQTYKHLVFIVEEFLKID